MAMGATLRLSVSASLIRRRLLNPTSTTATTLPGSRRLNLRSSSSSFPIHLRRLSSSSPRSIRPVVSDKGGDNDAPPNGGGGSSSLLSSAHDNVASSDFLGRVVPTELHKEATQAYMAYAMSVLLGRALPDVRDGLKPVHRRILLLSYSSPLSLYVSFVFFLFNIYLCLYLYSSYFLPPFLFAAADLPCTNWVFPPGNLSKNVLALLERYLDCHPLCSTLPLIFIYYYYNGRRFDV